MLYIFSQYRSAARRKVGTLFYHRWRVKIDLHEPTGSRKDGVLALTAFDGNSASYLSVLQARKMFRLMNTLSFIVETLSAELSIHALMSKEINSIAAWIGKCAAN